MFKLTVATLEKKVFDDEVISLVVPGEEGYLQILTDHTEIIVSLQPGRMTIVDKDEKTLLFAISGGFLEMSHNQASLLADAVEPLDQIDLKRAEKALENAKNHLKTPSEKTDISRAKSALKRAKNRIKLYREYQSVTSGRFI